MTHDTPQRLDRAYMVKQWVAEIQTSRGARFRVFTTGDDKYYFFDPIDRDGCSGCIGFPVRKTELRRDVASMLNRGCGNYTPGEPRG